MTDTPHCKTTDVFKIKDGCPPEMVEDLDNYFKQFQPAKIVDGAHVCPNCNKELDSFLQILGTGVAWKWGLVHGEASCSGCSWPARGNHRIKDRDGKEICTLSRVFLAYHPDEVSITKEERENTNAE